VDETRYRGFISVFLLNRDTGVRADPTNMQIRPSGSTASGCERKSIEPLS
jgi:hypothetical protein